MKNINSFITESKNTKCVFSDEAMQKIKDALSNDYEISINNAGSVVLKPKKQASDRSSYDRIYKMTKSNLTFVAPNSISPNYGTRFGTIKGKLNPNNPEEYIDELNKYVERLKKYSESKKFSNLLNDCESIYYENYPQLATEIIDYLVNCLLKNGVSKNELNSSYYDDIKIMYDYWSDPKANAKEYFDAQKLFKNK